MCKNIYINSFLIVGLLHILLNMNTQFYFIPNLLLLTPFRNYTKKMWDQTVSVDKTIFYKPSRIPIIYKKDYNYDILKKASNYFREPVLIKGLFLDTPAVNNWAKTGYLSSSKIGNYSIYVKMDSTYHKSNNSKTIMKFKDVFENILHNPNDKSYLFFPKIFSNDKMIGTEKELTIDVNNIIKEDLLLDSRIYEGYTKHPNYRGGLIKLLKFRKT